MVVGCLPYAASHCLQQADLAPRYPMARALHEGEGTNVPVDPPPTRHGWSGFQSGLKASCGTTSNRSFRGATSAGARNGFGKPRDWSPNLRYRDLELVYQTIEDAGRWVLDRGN
jgi:hypothetical protein